MEEKNTIKILLIGGGAISEKFYLPTLKIIQSVKVVGLVEPVVSNRNRLHASFGLPAIYDDLVKVPLDSYDAAVVATPNYLHFPMCLNLLKQFKHVLVEKPLCFSVDEGYQLLNTAQSVDRLLQVAYVRRHYPSLCWLKQFLSSYLLGDLIKIDIREGSQFSWPLRSHYLFNKSLSGGGVFIDLGSHTINQLLFLLGNLDVESFHYDAMGGVEANCLTRFKFGTKGTGTYMLSRIKPMSNNMELTFEKGKVIMGLQSDSIPLVYVSSNTSKQQLELTASVLSGSSFKSSFECQIQHFILNILNKQIQYETKNTIQAIQTIDIINKCYQIAQRWQIGKEVF